jgi:alpha-tubulin suppressor-like RCC1 family protein
MGMGSKLQWSIGSGHVWQQCECATQIGSDSDWSYAVSDGSAVLALKMDGSLWAWGYNGDGRLGLGYASQVVSIPIQVGTENDWASVSIYGTSLGIKADGTLWAWGTNWNGEVGNGTSGNYPLSPTQIGADADWAYASSWDGSFALKQDGSLWAWGNNWSGKLGTANFSNPLTQPTKIETTVAWQLPSAIRIQTNSPSPSNLRVPRIVSGTSLALKRDCARTRCDLLHPVVCQWQTHRNGERCALGPLPPSRPRSRQPRRPAVCTLRRYVLDASGGVLDVATSEIDVVRDAHAASGCGTAEPCLQRHRDDAASRL